MKRPELAPPGDRRNRRAGRGGVRKVDAAYLEKAALHYLERFASSAANLRRVLLRKVRRSAEAHGTDPEAGEALIEQLIARYRQAGLLDDAAYAQARAASLHRRGASTRAIQAELAAKGVDVELTGAALGELAAASGELDLAAACNFVRRRRLGPCREAAKRRAFHDKDLAALGRAGFSYDVARRVLACRSLEALEQLAAESTSGPDDEDSPGLTR